MMIDDRFDGGGMQRGVGITCRFTEVSEMSNALSRVHSLHALAASGATVKMSAFNWGIVDMDQLSLITQGYGICDLRKHRCVWFTKVERTFAAHRESTV